MTARLEVEIGAEIKELKSKVNQASSELKDFSNKADKDLGKFGKASTKAGKGLKGLEKGAVSGTSAMTAFSRTVQDVPFGIMGVSNNITNLTEQFGYLKNKTGSAGGALKAMLRDLKGFGGISLAISVATSLMLVFGDKIFATKNRVKELRKAQEDLTKSLDDYAFGLEAVAKANLKGQQSAQKEITTFKLLSAQVNNTNLSLDQRKGAIEELRKKYPSYLKNMTDEKLLNGGLATVYDTLTTSILKRAKATASMNAIIKNSEMLLALEGKLAAAKDEATKKEDAYQKKLASGKASQRSGVVVGLQQLKNEAKFAEDAVNSLEGQIQSLELTNIDLEANVADVGGIVKAIVPDDTEDKVRSRVDSVFESLKSGYIENVKGFQDIATATPTSVLGSTLTQFDKEQGLLKAKMLDFNMQITDLIQNNLASTFSNIGKAIGNGLAQGTDVLAAVGGALISGIGNLISAMGDKLIELGTAAILAGTVTKLFGSVLGIGAGFAAIAGGIALNAIGAGISNFGGAGAGGSNAQGGSGSRGGSSSGGFTSGFSGSSGSQNVVFEIAGTKLVGVLSNTLQRNKNLGGSLQITT